MDLDDEELKATRKLNGLNDDLYKKEMEDRIEVGEYVRTKNGEIGVFDRYSSRKENSLYKSLFYCFIKIRNRKTPLQCCEDYIAKHSKQLMDLIEIGDYVNGMQVLDVYKPRDLWEPIEIRVDSRYMNFILAEDIQKILTKEQMMANCYKVGGENE